MLILGDISEYADASDVSENIRRALANEGYHGTRYIYAYGNKDRHPYDFTSAGIKFLHFPSDNISNTLILVYLDLPLYIWFESMSCVS